MKRFQTQAACRIEQQQMSSSRRYLIVLKVSLAVLRYLLLQPIQLLLGGFQLLLELWVAVLHAQWIQESEFRTVKSMHSCSNEQGNMRDAHRQ